ncbi:nitroreductase [Brevibacillus fulvus]|uniref:Nitroreductase n=1 Tax=Brevibacillus fulvus TaxID=1125967 RepID=A0A938XY66_9BACL|nr:nitroreductase [Brevibacillus fulvus]MBM7590349.1 nitroreductase [Brevibacillus fulvus]
MSIFAQRRTVRKYTQKPVDKDLLTKVLTEAVSAPSWANSQPWEVYVAAGDVLEQLRAAYTDSFDKGEPGNPDLAYPQSWPDYLQERMNRAYQETFQAMGIERDDKQAREANWRNNFRFFEAPVAVFLCLDQSLNEWSILDLGLFAQNLMLAAVANGLDCAPAASSISYPQHLRRILGIPEQHKIIVGIMLGYGDHEHPYNQVKTSRVPLTENIRLIGIE